jgi:hypothetical protein
MHQQTKGVGAKTAGRQTLRPQAVLHLANRLLRHLAPLHIKVPVHRRRFLLQVGDDKAALAALGRHLDLGHDPPRMRPTVRLIIGQRLKALHHWLTPAVEVVIQLHIGQRLFGSPQQNRITGIAQGIGQTVGLAIVLQARHRQTVVRTHLDRDAWPGGP